MFTAVDCPCGGHPNTDPTVRPADSSLGSRGFAECPRRGALRQPEAACADGNLSAPRKAGVVACPCDGHLDGFTPGKLLVDGVPRTVGVAVGFLINAGSVPPRIPSSAIHIMFTAADCPRGGHLDGFTPGKSQVVAVPRTVEP